jgi:hypothetical protein
MEKPRTDAQTDKKSNTETTQCPFCVTGQTETSFR